MRLFDRVGRNAGKGLLDVPGAAGGGIAQACHDGKEALDPPAAVMDQVVVHALPPAVPRPCIAGGSDGGQTHARVGPLIASLRTLFAAPAPSEEARKG